MTNLNSMTNLNTKPNITRPDDFYAKLLALHEGLSNEESEALNARLVLILSNHIGDSAILEEAFTLAAEAGSKQPSREGEKA